MFLILNYFLYALKSDVEAYYVIEKNCKMYMFAIFAYLFKLNKVRRNVDI